MSRSLGATTVVLVLALLAACGAQPTVASSPAPPAASGAFPVSVPHAFGRTTIAAAPTRVVTLGYTDQDAVIALGVVPVGTAEWYGDQPGALFPWARTKIGDAPLPTVLKTANGIPFEQVAALHPDLILCLYCGLAQDEYTTLAAIAPTVAQPADRPAYGIPWDVQTRTVGMALGRSAQADTLVAGVEQKIAATAAAHPEFHGRTALVGAWFNDHWYAYSSRDLRGRLLTQLGFTVPAQIDELAGDQFGATISFERADLLEVDALVWVGFTAAELDKITSSPGYATSPVATQGRALFVASEPVTPLEPMTGFISVLSLPVLLDALPARLAAAVDGDPATQPQAVAPLS